MPAKFGKCLPACTTPMTLSKTFALRVFLCAGLYGILALVPLYFMEDLLGRLAPPAFNRPEQFYSFLGVAVAWQFAFLLIARDVARYRLFMLPAAAEKLLASGAVLLLWSQGRVDTVTAAPAAVDLLLGLLFLAVFVGYRPCAKSTPS